MKTSLKKFFITIGIIIFSLVMFSVPILTACSFCLSWSSHSKFILTILTIVQLVILVSYVSYQVNTEDA